MRAKEALRRPLKQCTPLSSLEDVGRMMWESDQGAIPVVDAGGKLVGILSDREIAMAMAAKNRGAGQILVRELLGEERVSCGADDTVAEVFGKMRRHRMRNVPVVDSESRILGVLSLEDLAHAAMAGAGPEADRIPSEELVRTLQALGQTRVEAGETPPRWPWVNAASR